MSELLARIARGDKPLIGVVALRALAGSSRYRGAALHDVLAHALQQAAQLRSAGFACLIVQNLGDLPVTSHVEPAQIAWMTRIAAELRREHGGSVGINFLENDAAAMFAVASAAALDFVRVKVHVGAMVTPGGIETGQAFHAMRARTALQADAIAILADVHDRTGTPVAAAGLADDVRAAFEIGGADAVVLTGRSHAETLDYLAVARAAFADRPLIAGGGVSAETLAGVWPACDGAIVSSALRSGGLFGLIDAVKLDAFSAAVTRVRGRHAERLSPPG